MMTRLARWLGYGLFFGWNLAFLTFVWIGLGPIVMAPLSVAVAVGLIPWNFALVGAVILAIPVVFPLFGLWKLRGDPGRLVSLFYGVEAPLLFLCLLRLFAVQQLSAPTTLLLLTGLVAVGGLLRTLLAGPSEGRGALLLLRLVAAAIGLVLGAGGLGLVLVYAPPAVYHLAHTFVQVTGSLRLEDLAWAHVVVPTLLLLGTTGVVFAVYPLAAFGLSIRQWQLVQREARLRFGRAASLGTTGATVLALLGAFGWAGQQPQADVFEAIDAATDDRARRALMADEGPLRGALVATALAPYRLLDGDPAGDHVLHLWTETFGAAPATAARALWRTVTWPFRFHPVTDAHTWTAREGTVPSDVLLAQQHYARLFDAPIERAEREAFLAAVRATWSTEDAHAGLLEIGDRKVRLTRQDIAVTPDADAATVRIHDVYRNGTFAHEEVLIAFSLPETAAVTGLWLSRDGDFATADRYVVATRGAAQEVYERSVRRSVDPALLEQVGPHHYRLRVFPVPAREADLERPLTIEGEGAELHLWLEYAVLADTTEAPCWPMPEVSETRNLGIDPDERTLDGAAFAAPGWAPACVPAPGVVPVAHRATVGDHLVEAVPAGPASAVSLGRVAVLVDGSRSMARHVAAVDAALESLRVSSDRVETWCVVEDAVAACSGFEADTALFFGDTPVEERLVALAPRLGDVDRVVVLTDAGSYEVSAARAPRWPTLTLPPTWFVHLGGWPNAWADWTLDHVGRSGGGFVSSVDALVLRAADPTRRDGRRFSDAPGAGAPEACGPWSSIAARRRILDLDRERRSGALADLDALHALAVRAHVVTPWSSMLVVVSDDQRRQLATAEARADRFEREGIDAAAPELSSVPEPGPVLLFGTTLALGLVHHRRRLRAAVTGQARAETTHTADASASRPSRAWGRS